MNKEYRTSSINLVTTKKDTKKFIDYDLYLLKNSDSFFNKASVSTKQKMVS